MGGTLLSPLQWGTKAKSERLLPLPLEVGLRRGKRQAGRELGRERPEGCRARGEAHRAARGRWQPCPGPTACHRPAV